MNAADPPSSASAEAPRIWHKRADRPLRGWRKSLGVWLFARAAGVPVPWSAIAQRDGAALLAHEHQRLLALHAAGEHVPRVLGFDGQTLQMADLGPNLHQPLEKLDADSKRQLMLDATSDLAVFHAHGHWHGGAQVRNVTWDGQRFGRLDFEERLHPALPLAVVQRYDLLQHIVSLSRWTTPMGPGVLVELLRTYERARTTAGAGDAGLRPFLAGLLPRLRALASLVRWTGLWRTSREAARLGVLIQGLQGYLTEGVGPG